MAEALNNVVPLPGVFPAGMARVNITFAGENGDLPDPVAYDLADAAVRRIASESLLGGSIPGIARVETPDLGDFVVDRFPATAELPARLFVRPKVPFGA